MTLTILRQLDLAEDIHEMVNGHERSSEAWRWWQEGAEMSRGGWEGERSSRHRVFSGDRLGLGLERNHLGEVRLRDVLNLLLFHHNPDRHQTCEQRVKGYDMYYGWICVLNFVFSSFRTFWIKTAVHKLKWTIYTLVFQVILEFINHN